MNRQQPLMERDVRILKNRANGDRELLTAGIAVIYALADAILGAFARLQFGSVIEHTAVRTDRAIRPVYTLDVRPRRIFIPMSWSKQSSVFFAHGQSLSDAFCFVKCIIQEKCRKDRFQM